MRGRNGLADFDAAIQFAVREQQVNKQYGIRRRGEEPMDVSAATKGKGRPVEEKLDSLCNKLGALLTSEKAVDPPSRDFSTDDKLNLLVAKVKDLEKKVQCPSPAQPSAARRTANAPGPFSPVQLPSQWNTSSPSAPRYEWTPEGQPICGYCRNIGHMVRNCRTRRAHQRQERTATMAPFRSQVNW